MPEIYYEAPGATLWNGDCRQVIDELPTHSVNAIIADPPYHLTSITERFGKEGSAPAKYGKDGAFGRVSKGFANKTWDGTYVAFDPETWRKHLRIIKPGGWLAVFGHPRTHYRMGVAIEDAGFVIYDTAMWVYGQGMAKGINISKALDKLQGIDPTVVGTRLKKAGDIRSGNYIQDTYPDIELDITEPTSEAAKEWKGWHSLLKPGYEPIIIARAPLVEGVTVAEHTYRYGTAAFNIDACRVERDPEDIPGWHQSGAKGSKGYQGTDTFRIRDMSPEEIQERCGGVGRYPSNLLLSHSYDCTETWCDPYCPVGALNEQGGLRKSGKMKAGTKRSNREGYAGPMPEHTANDTYGDQGAVSRYFKTFSWDGPLCYCPKPSKNEKTVEGELDEKHPTVKPLTIMRYLCRLLSPPGGTIFDGFYGTGTTGVAALAEGFRIVAAENDPDYLPIAKHRTERAVKEANLPPARKDRMALKNRDIKIKSLKKFKL